MGTNRFLIRVRPLSIILLAGLCMYSSCIKERPMERSAHDVLASRGISYSFSLKDFFSHSIDKLDSVITMLAAVNEEKDFIGDFLREYGIPLWNCTYVIDDGVEKTFFVPLYNGQSTMEINSLWFFHISSDGKMIYAPFRRNDPSIEGNEQCFVFDLLSYLVFGEDNAKGLVFEKREESSRAYIVTEQCWDVYTGTAGNLEYQYTNCITNTYWIDETYYWMTQNPDSGNGGSIGGGDGDNSGSSGNGGSSTSATTIFQNENFSEDSWELADYLLEDILDDCLGEKLFNEIKSELNGEKVTLRFTNNNEGSSYNWDSNTLSIDVNQLQSNILLHEMIHLYQVLSETNSSFENSLLNREIEAHYAQYLFIKRQSVLWNVETNNIYDRNERLRSCILMNSYIDDYGNIRDENLKDEFESLLIGNVVSAFQNDGYDNYPFNYETIENTFDIIQEITINCN